MHGHEPLAYIPLCALLGTTVLLIFLAVEAGFAVRRWRQRRAEHERGTPVGAIVGAILGLPALPIAFTYGLGYVTLRIRRGARFVDVAARSAIRARSVRDFA
jgi:hypothetical protein